MKKCAFLFGVNDYSELPQLRYARQDAEAVAKALKEAYGFGENEIFLRTCKNESAALRPSNRRRILSAFDWSEALGVLDLLIVGFWGHGSIDERTKKRYLCPIDAEMGDLPGTAVSLDQIKEAIRQIPAKNVCLILDCCQNVVGEDRDSAAFSLEEGAKENLDAMARDIGMSVSKNTTHGSNIHQTVAILNSCSEGERAYEWAEREHGFFTAHLLEALHERKNMIADVFEYAKEKTIESVRTKGKKQNPFCSCYGGMNIVLPAPPSVEEELYNQALELFQEEKYSEAKAKIDAAIENSPKKEYIALRVSILGILKIQEKTLLIEREKENLAQEKAEIERRRQEDARLAREKAEIERKAAEIAKQKASSTAPLAGDRLVKTIKGVEYAWRWCPAGEFMMGSPKGEKGRDDDEKQHRVTLTQGFWMLETQVTQRMWQSVMGDNPSFFKGDNLPVECVSWHDCVKFCEKISKLSGLNIQLPTEAQWEYACRAGTTTALNSGKNLTDTEYDCANLNEVAWYDWKGENESTHPVGQKRPNAWGLYDMHGNVWEWCQDWYGEYVESPTSDPKGPNSGSNRVNRGGGWHDYAESCRSAYRGSYDPPYSHDAVGFRLLFVP
ncbi:MAG: SUMF1/EgtB/PvdO family nonheme iron enzyme [Planctomycetia bacterium]|nr:SUMF1/EgtB/PvdO family nonheme iron enzyme [Planctomycetia bacterium]